MRILPLTLFSVFLVLSGTPNTESIVTRAPPVRARPLCLSQFALANHACSMLPFSATPYAPPQYSIAPPPPAELLQGTAHHSHSHHHHHHSHSHSHSHVPHQDQNEHRSGGAPVPIQEECCRWLMAVDDECICEVLLHLPIFLARPFHRYSVVVDKSCSITYNCGGRIFG